jgi:hypothetical protein
MTPARDRVLSLAVTVTAVLNVEVGRTRAIMPPSAILEGPRSIAENDDCGVLPSAKAVLLVSFAHERLLTPLAVAPGSAVAVPTKSRPAFVLRMIRSAPLNGECDAKLVLMRWLFDDQIVGPALKVPGGEHAYRDKFRRSVDERAGVRVVVEASNERERR